MTGGMTGLRKETDNSQRKLGRQPNLSIDPTSDVQTNKPPCLLLLETSRKGFLLPLERHNPYKIYRMSGCTKRFLTNKISLLWEDLQKKQTKNTLSP